MLRKALRALIFWAIRPSEAELDAMFDAALQEAIRAAELCAPLIGHTEKRPTIH